ncbi:DUF1653 domain-containing protein [Megasphaera lornae]|jgi:hypothetical protein|uniref:DUF1653 domain-containing protein n=1 Tax=Megasphaera lornae TaxID=1000568 RepID=D3LT43_9FIRM|nr:MULTISPECIES: DUF1653 domain-containing protein [Megasphaera]EFD94613.1 hypothetical protein HMPREF0889_0029 [Megasphaera genomosp. type_1 str. 28L]EGL42368.1 hypothetical protein HMPREF1039_0795 [Megasphaera lornae]KXB92510.1 hypothetical protein HMPREF3033_00665 [Veillonellaceae bacterium DNF00751]MUP50335.1 DUF1653 domain-containing protein [Veillonellaceae bacterium M1-70]
MRENPKAHEIWRHFKNNDYEIITVAEHTETGEKFVIYKPVNNPERHYARPLRMFMSETDMRKYPKAVQRYRFEKK